MARSLPWPTRRAPPSRLKLCRTAKSLRIRISGQTRTTTIPEMTSPSACTSTRAPPPPLPLTPDHPLPSRLVTLKRVLFRNGSQKAKGRMQGDRRRTRPRHTAVRERAAAANAQPGEPSCLACLAAFRVALRTLCLSLCSPSCGKGHPWYSSARCMCACLGRRRG